MRLYSFLICLILLPLVETYGQMRRDTIIFSDTRHQFTTLDNIKIMVEVVIYPKTLSGHSGQQLGCRGCQTRVDSNTFRIEICNPYFLPFGPGGPMTTTDTMYIGRLSAGTYYLCSQTYYGDTACTFTNSTPAYTFTVTDATDVSETRKPGIIGVSPNPVLAETFIVLTLPLQTKTVELFDVAGKFIHSFRVENLNYCALPVDGLPAGLYMIRASGDGSVHQVRMQKL